MYNLRRAGYQGNPWYRGYMPRSYVPPTFIASFGCAICLIFFGIFLLLAGTIMTAVTHKKPEPRKPPFDDPFFAKHDKDPSSSPFYTIGPVLLGIGAFFVVGSILICCFARYSMKKQEDQRRTQQQEPMVIPPAGSYPQQPAQYPAGSYPQQQAQYPAGSYPQQPAQYPTGSYPSQPGQNPAEQQYPAPHYPPAQYSDGTQHPTTPYSQPPQYPVGQYPLGQQYPAPQETKSDSSAINPPPYSEAPPIGFKTS